MAGSIQERNGKFLLTVSSGYGVGGKRQRFTKTISAKSRYEAEKELAKFVTEVENGTFIDNKNITLKEFADKWISEYAEKNLAPKTISRHKELLERINHCLGHIKLKDLKPLHIIEFYNNLSEDGVRKDGLPGGLSEQTIKHHHRTLHAVLEAAVKWDMLLNNPASKVDAPKIPKREAKHYNTEQTMLMLEKLEDEPMNLKAIVLLALYGGMRLGEICGLEWKDFNFNDRTVCIRRTSQYVDRKVITKEPKNETSIRTVTLPASLISYLKEYRVWWNGLKASNGDKWRKTDRLFTGLDGRDIHPTTPSKTFLNFIRKNSLPELNFHGLRHTSASLLISQGLDIATISKRLGHSNTSTTLNIYSHAFKKLDTTAADTLEGLLNNQNSKLEKSIG